MTVIAVIGAGAAGLAASRHLLRCGLQPCIFEGSARVGGAWNNANNNNNSQADKMWDALRPNLSKYTCQFSEMPWSATDNDNSPAAAGAAFGTRQDVLQYLEQYAANFVDPQCFRFGCTVTQVKQSSSTDTATAATTTTAPSMPAFQQRYQVEWHEPNGVAKSEEFDGVIVATGFFATPVVPEGLMALYNNNDDNNNESSSSSSSSSLHDKKVIHSAQYKSPEAFADQTVTVVGASFSALEIAADVRKRACRVVSIVPHIPWVLPRYVPMPTTADCSDEERDKFVPLDVVLYRRDRDAPQTPAAVQMDETACRQKHQLLQSLSGTRKQAALGIPADPTVPPLLAISDDYLNLVVDGNIDVVHGRVASATSTTQDDRDKVAITLEDGQVLTDIDRIITCTGYKSQLDFLDEKLLQTLEYDAADGYAPLSLCYDAFHPKVPGLGFVGMYKGPYFGIMEMQARLLAGMMSGQVSPSDEAVTQAWQDSQQIRQGAQKNRAQFPRFDYVGTMDTLAEQVDLVPDKALFGSKGMMVTPAFYQPSDEMAQRAKEALDAELDSKGGSANVAKIALSALVGKWTFDRTITQCSSSDPPQRVRGEIAFSCMQPTNEKQEWNTVLYNENGIFEIVPGKELEVFRQYEYEYKDDGVLEIFFVENGKRAHLFLSLKFTKHENGYWVATNDHLCIKDLYMATFKIKFDGIGASEVSMRYRVKGPNKDYESMTHLKPL